MEARSAGRRCADEDHAEEGGRARGACHARPRSWRSCLAAALAAAGCDMPSTGGLGQVIGSGTPVTKYYDFTGFTKVAVDSGFKVDIDYAETGEVVRHGRRQPRQGAPQGRARRRHPAHRPRGPLAVPRRHPEGQGGHAAHHRAGGVRRVHGRGDEVHVRRSTASSRRPASSAVHLAAGACRRRHAGRLRREPRRGQRVAGGARAARCPARAPIDLTGLGRRAAAGRLRRQPPRPVPA